MVGNTMINHLMYADDLVIISPILVAQGSKNYLTYVLTMVSNLMLNTMLRRAWS